MSVDAQQDPIYIPYAGPQLTATALLNKGTAFTEQERRDFNLTGLIPARYETIEQQAHRAYIQYQTFDLAINKHIYLRMLQDTNETLFFYLLQQHLSEMMPIVYTPTVGDACERFSEIYRRARGLFISYPDRFHLDDVLHNATKENVKVIVVTDGSRILGLGDQGVGGMGIPIGKLALYTACGGISPAYTLPVMLDVGTDNKALLDDPRYIGWHNPRITGEQYNEFIELFIQAVQKRWPDALVQFEDFEQAQALPLLNRYQDRLCCFNDDIQGTAAVTAGTLLSACRIKQERLSEQTIVFAGAGSAGCGIAEQLIRQMCEEGLTEADARSRIFMVDRPGLLAETMSGLADFQQKLAVKASHLKTLQINAGADLQQVIERVRPTVLIGVSGQAGLFSETIIKAMAEHCRQPVIFPLSNPSRFAEASPKDLLNWTGGKALIASGSPFAPVDFDATQFAIAQCNNSYIFPGLGLAVVAANIRRLNDDLLMTASQVLAETSQNCNARSGLLPPLTESQAISKKIAFAVGKQAIKNGLAPAIHDDALQKAIDKNFWRPVYRQYRRTSI